MRIVWYGREKSGVDPRGGDWEKEGRSKEERKEGKKGGKLRFRLKGEIKRGDAYLDHFD